jgi:hypothetical protein
MRYVALNGASTHFGDYSQITVLLGAGVDYVAERGALQAAGRLACDPSQNDASIARLVECTDKAVKIMATHFAHKSHSSKRNADPQR